ncbi:vinorine synthase-like [Ricinus communis]|uniref:Anthranilate N-benzoyltransferase protein, putative n=1 Tax=Ricinus communis TaxID=3988 RepID=B9SUB8_RICCO|nr:vinorine synthase-like [Ricinus communis]EEF32779.1 Anthranilate N-benzoyltransferase protein, putative [Ricinus communis]|eukprot:XP_002529587.1 vinorine synthase [Ricinus communis]
MEVHIVSREMMKPSSPAIKHQKPYKLCLLDQLTPTTYIPIIFFYPMNNLFTKSTLAHLKESLVKTLNFYYPFSGRAKDNLYIDRFEEGVPFFEAKVNCSMSYFLKHYETESLSNLFIPSHPFSKEIDMSIALVAVQVSMFTCGGIAVGLCLSHKLIDAATASSFVTTWASFCRGDPKNVIQPDFEQPSTFFPSSTSLPQNYLSLMERIWFVKANYITKRFVFDAKAIAALRVKAKAKLEAEPTRIATLSCFIWKCSMAASRAISGAPKPSILVEAVNLRQKTKPPMKDSSTGNLFWWAVALASPTDTNSTELNELVSMLSEAIAVYKSDYTHSLQGENGLKIMSEYCEQLEGMFSLEEPDIFGFTSWSKMPVTRPNFGWGEPFWVGLMAKAGPEFRNFTVFIDTKDGKGIEAWITLDEARMAILQRDPEFLAFASPNPKISSL